MRIFSRDYINTGKFIAGISTVGASFILLSCTTTVPVPHPSDAQQSAQEKIDTKSEIKWSPRQIATERHYLINDTTTIISSAEDSANTRSFETIHIYTVSTTRINDSLLALTTMVSPATASNDSVASFKLNSDSKITPRSKATISTTGRFTSLSRESSSICSQGLTPIEARVYDLVVSYPAKALELGDQWADTITTTVCRNRILLHEQNIRQYKIVEYATWNQLPDVEITLLSASSIVTDSSRTHSPLTAKGLGKSSTMLYVDRLTGALLESKTNSQMDLTIITARGLFPFTQTVSSHILLR